MFWYMENPFEIILTKLEHPENLIKGIQKPDSQPIQAPGNDIMNLVQAAKYLSLSKSSVYKSTSQRSSLTSREGKRFTLEKQIWINGALKCQLRQEKR